MCTSKLPVSIIANIEKKFKLYVLMCVAIQITLYTYAGSN